MFRRIYCGSEIRLRDNDMPGIFGIIRKRQSSVEENKGLIEGMLKKLSHTEIYKCQTYVEDWFALGHIGVPFLNEKRISVDSERQCVAGYSGFIYGWKNIGAGVIDKTSDKPLQLINIYIGRPADFFQKIDGSFNAAIFNIESREATIFNDHFGHRQLYYYEDPEIFLFSTEYKAFLSYEKFPRDLDHKGVADYFNFGYLLGDKTFFRDVRILRGGHIVTFKNGGISLKQYWDYRFPDESNQPIQELIEEVDALYPSIIKKQTAGAKNVLIPLSGGLDSRFILGHAVRAGIEPHVFTHGRAGCIDSRIAGQVSKKLALRNFGFIEIDPDWLASCCERYVYLSDGMISSNPAVYLGIGEQYALPPETTAFLNGIFGGLTNFGESYFKLRDVEDNLLLEEKLKRTRQSIQGEARDESFYSRFQPEWTKILKQNYLPSIEREFSRYLGVSRWYCHQLEAFLIGNRLFRLMNQIDCNRYLWHDHFALADDGLFEFYLKLPNGLKPSRKFMVEYFKAKFPDLARVPYQATGVDLYSRPSQFRKKIHNAVGEWMHYAERASMGKLRLYDSRRYLHQNQWYRKSRKVSSYFEDILLDSKTANRGYFNMNEVKSMLNQQKRGVMYFQELASLISFELFNRLFVD